MGELVTPRREAPSPALVYLAQLSPGAGRRSAACQLSNVAEILTGSRDIGAIDWSLLDRTTVIAIVETLRRQGKAITTINHCLSILKRVSEESWDMGIVSTDTYRRISKVRALPGSRAPAGRAPSREEVREAIERARQAPALMALRDAAVIATLAGTGLRCFELATLRMEHYAGRHLLVEGKGGKQARQPVSPAAAEILEEYIGQVANTGPLFVRWRINDTPGVTPLSTAGIALVLDRWLTDVTPHDLRRAYATWLSQDGHQLPVIQRLMRHSSPTTTMRYVRNEEELLSASENLLF